MRNSDKNNINFIKKVDYVLFFLLILFAIIGTLSYQIHLINNIDIKYKKYDKKIDKLLLLNSGFNNFLLNKRISDNYDSISAKIKQFDALLNDLNEKQFDNLFNKNIKETIYSIHSNFSKKEILLERFKSNNALSIYSLNYLIDLVTHIKIEQDIEKNFLKIINNSIYDLLRLFLNQSSDVQILDEEINSIKFLNKQIKNDKLDLFNTNLMFAKKKIIYANKIKKEAFKIKMNENLELLLFQIDKKFKIVRKKEVALIYFLFIVIFIITIGAVYIYLKSLKIKKDLISLRYAVENSDDSIVITDINSNIVYTNEAFTKVTGYTREEALGKNPNILKSGKMSNDFYKEMHNHLSKGEKWVGEFINKNKNGDLYYERASITPMFTNAKLTGYLAIKLNITDYIKEQERVKFLAYSDPLTSLGNRRMMKKIILEELENIETSKKQLYVFLWI